MKKIIYQTLPSTQIEANLQLKSILPPFIVMANIQTAGYGKYGRVWESFEGNFFATIAVTLNIEHYEFSKLPMLICIKLCSLLSQLTDTKASFSIKWPNDILLNKKKICGILIEKVDNTFLIGIGINLKRSPDTVNASYAVTNILHETGILIEPEKVLDKLSEYFDRFDTALTKWNFVQLRQTYMALLEGKGQTIKVVMRNETVTGQLYDINNDGALILKLGEENKLIYAADIFI